MDNNAKNTQPGEQIIRSEFVLNILLIGDAKVGKSSLINYFCEGKTKEGYIRTLGCDIRIKNLIINDKIINIKFFDLGEFDYNLNIDILEKYFQIAHACLYVYDPNNKNTINNFEKFNKLNLFKEKGVNVIVANKNKKNIKDKKHKEIFIKAPHTFFIEKEINFGVSNNINLFFDDLINYCIEYFDKKENKEIYTKKNEIQYEKFVIKYRPLKKKKNYSCCF